MDPLGIGNTLRAHHSFRAALYLPDMMESIRPQQSVSHRQQERSTAQEEIAALQARKNSVRIATRELVDRMKDSMDTHTFHHVLQGIMDIQGSKKTTSEVIERLRPLVAHGNPKLFQDFLDCIDPGNVDRQETTNESTKADDNPSSDRSGSKAPSDHSASPSAGQLPRSSIHPGSSVHPGQSASPIRRVANFSQFATKVESPYTRETVEKSSPGMHGFPVPPEYYSPIPPTFAQSFFDYVNQDRPVLPCPVETAMPTRGLSLPHMAAASPHDLQNTNTNNVVRLPSVGRFGPGVNPYSPRAGRSSQMGPPQDFPMRQNQLQQQFRPPKTRSTLLKPAVASTVASHQHVGASQYPSSMYEGDVTFLSPQKPPHDNHAFATYNQDVYFNLPNAPTMQVTRQAPLQRKRGMEDLRSSAEQAQPRKVSRTDSGRSSIGRFGTPPDDENEKPYVHHICGRRFTTLAAVKGHHHSKQDGLGCWVRHGSKEKDRAWDMHPSCKMIEKEASAGTTQEPSRLPIQPSTAKPARTTKTSRRKAKSKQSLKTTSSSSEHQQDDDDEYLPELGMTQKQLDEISGARPKRATRKASGTKRGAAKK